MKTLTKKIFGWSSVVVLATGLTSSVTAGPGPQYWQQQDTIRADNAAKAKATVSAAKSADAAAMACPSCRTSDIVVYRPGGAGGKVPARYDKIGTKHTCSACGGAVTTVRGNTTNDMTANCPIRAKAKAASAACCTATS